MQLSQKHTKIALWETYCFCITIVPTLQGQYYWLCLVNYVLWGNRYIDPYGLTPEKRIFAHKTNCRLQICNSRQVHCHIFFIAPRWIYHTKGQGGWHIWSIVATVFPSLLYSSLRDNCDNCHAILFNLKKYFLCPQTIRRPTQQAISSYISSRHGIVVSLRQNRKVLAS